MGLERGPEGENSSLVDTLMLCDSKMWKGEEEMRPFSSPARVGDNYISIQLSN